MVLPYLWMRPCLNYFRPLYRWRTIALALYCTWDNAFLSAYSRSPAFPSGWFIDSLIIHGDWPWSGVNFDAEGRPLAIPPITLII